VFDRKLACVDTCVSVLHMTMPERRQAMQPHESSFRQRGDERRDWPRREMCLEVKDGDGAWFSCLGDLSVEGAAFSTATPPTAEMVTVRFAVPTLAEPVIATAKVVARVGRWQDTHVSVQFLDLPIEHELALAAWFHAVSSPWPSGNAVSAP
jgi:hypothetical protein